MRAVIAVADPQNLEDICTILNMCLPDLRLLIADSSGNCIQMTKERNPDVVILEHHANLNTFVVIEQVRELTSAPIIVTSDRKNDSDVLKAIESGADEFCATPIMQLEFAAHVRALLRRRCGVKVFESTTSSRVRKGPRPTIALRVNTKGRLDNCRAAGQSYDGLLREMVDLWENNIREHLPMR